MDDNNELIIYVLQQLRYDVPEEAIRTTLAQNGWPQPLIDRAFSMVQQAAPHTVPPTGYNDAPTQQQASTPAADLPSPAENPFPVVEEVRQEKQQSGQGGVLRTLLVSLVVFLLLAAASFAGYLIYRAMQDHSSKTPRTSQAAQKDLDPSRKKTLNNLVSKLTAYYIAQNTYPTLDDINNDAFVGSKGGFDVNKFRDPSWNAKKSPCVDGKGRAILTDVRSEGCYSYRVTAMNGDDCDGSSRKCTRVVLIATMKGNRPYIVALDQNVKE